MDQVRHSPRGVGYRTLDLTSPWRAPGLPVIFQHGLGLNGTAWRPWMRRIAADHPVVASDMRGHGASKSAWTAPSLDLEDYASDVLDVLDSLGVDRTVFVGESFGGTVGLYLAVTRPDRIAGVAVASTGWRGDMVNNIADWPETLKEPDGLKAWSDMILAGSFDPAVDDSALIAWAEERQLSVMPEAAAALVLALRQADLGPDLDKLTMPVLNFVAHKSPFVDREQARILAERLTNYRQADFPEAKHRLFLTRAEDCAEIFADWLAGVT